MQFGNSRAEAPCVEVHGSTRCHSVVLCFFVESLGNCSALCSFLTQASHGKSIGKSVHDTTPRARLFTGLDSEKPREDIDPFWEAMNITWVCLKRGTPLALFSGGFHEANEDWDDWASNVWAASFIKRTTRAVPTVWGELASLRPHTLQGKQWSREQSGKHFWLLWQGLQPRKGWQDSCRWRLYRSWTAQKNMTYDDLWLWLSNADILGVSRLHSNTMSLWTCRGLKAIHPSSMMETKEPLVWKSGQRTGAVENFCGSCLNLEPHNPNSSQTIGFPSTHRLFSGKWVPYPNHCSCISICQRGF